jgi:K+-transporting ATPase KdpF subunit
MNTLYWLAGAIALGLSLYLGIALLKPEWFE